MKEIINIFIIVIFVTIIINVIIIVVYLIFLFSFAENEVNVLLQDVNKQDATKFFENYVQKDKIIFSLSQYALLANNK